MGSSCLWALEDENIDIENIDRPFKDRIAYFYFIYLYPSATSAHL